MFAKNKKHKPQMSSRFADVRFRKVKAIQIGFLLYFPFALNVISELQKLRIYNLKVIVMMNSKVMEFIAFSAAIYGFQTAIPFIFNE